MVLVVILFWSCCLLQTYVYVLYPVLVAALAARYGKVRCTAAMHFRPSQSL